MLCLLLYLVYPTALISDAQTETLSAHKFASLKFHIKIITVLHILTH